ncbi:hypothetical protein F4775DRAFT_586354 [Biscogniauxia sp. FL1348]|nr:hypothetical protein F4775DRAFT_586354 [Biscogniauxia sp. FL1348]
MVSLALLGLLCALGHHLYYTRLHGKRVDDPQWPTRFGIALAFFVKVVLVGSVEIAYRQQVWVIVKRRGLKVDTLDTLFLVCSDPFRFFSSEFIFKASVPAILAVVIWALPLCTIASPSTLTSKESNYWNITTCIDVPTLNLSRENGYGLTSDDSDLAGLSYWEIEYNDTYYGPSGRYTYDSPSAELQRIFSLTMLTIPAPLKPSSPCPNDDECTYSRTIDLPAYHCESRLEFGGTDPPAYTRSQLAPSGPLLYASYSSLTEDQGGKPLAWSNITFSSHDYGVFTEIPSLWVGWATDSDGYVPHIMECSMYDATYSYNFTFSGDQWTHNRTSTKLNSLLLPKGSTKSPTDPDYQQFSGYHAAGYLFRSFLAGNITLDQNETRIDYTNALQSDLLSQVTGVPISDDFKTAVETHFENIFISMITDDRLHSQTLSSTPCSIVQFELVWDYQPFWLALSYLLAVAFTLISILLGAYAFHENGYAFEPTFSTFITTSRNPDIDNLARGCCLGQWPMSEEVLHTTLRFGELPATPDQTNDQEAHAGFGFPDKVRNIDIKKKYI